jgi:phosphoribosyl-AMP cyclohydrolase
MEQACGHDTRISKTGRRIQPALASLAILRKPPASHPFEPLMTEETLLAAIRFDTAGLVAAIAQQHDTGEVLMLAWMNRDAVRETLASGRAVYWSRSRGALWRKGETSGQIQRVVAIRLDCDGDALLLSVDQTGVACHTGRRSCFFREVRDGEWVVIAGVEIDPEMLYGQS